MQRDMGAVCDALGVTFAGFEEEEMQTWANIHKRSWQEAKLLVNVKVEFLSQRKER